MIQIKCYVQIPEINPNDVNAHSNISKCLETIGHTK